MRLNYRMGNEERNQSGYYTARPEAAMLPFSLLSFGEFVCDGEYFTEREGQANFLFLGTISGCGELRYDGQEVLLPLGKAAVIDCSRYQYYGTSGQEDWRFFWFHFRGAAASAYVGMVNGCGLRAMDWDPETGKGYYKALTDFAAVPGKETDLSLSLWIHTLLNQAAASAESPTAVRYQKEILEAAEYMREHYNEPLRMTEVARRTGLSSYYFIRVFKKVTGQTTHEYLTILRVNKAKELLAFTDDDEHEICAKVGYAELKNMIVNFKRHTGMTPSLFRKQARAEQARLSH